MQIKFPDGFIFGTSTSAAQIETAFNHNWMGLKSLDGFEFNRTTDHEKRVAEDIEIISRLAPNYRMGLMWSRLQRQPYAQFDEETTSEYHQLLSGLVAKGVDIMMVIDHWVYPNWFSDAGGWLNEDAINLWLNFAKKLYHEFGRYVRYWNTFNEPNLFATFSYVLGGFPPFKKNIFQALTVVKRMARAHNEIYKHIKTCDSDSQIAISHNCVQFGFENVLGVIPATLARWWYQNYIGSLFTECDYIGVSYYARLSFDPYPVTNLYSPEKIKRSGKAADDIWEYNPGGLAEVIRYFWKTYRKPIMIVENGICTADDRKRVQSVRDYMVVINELLNEGISIKGYYHWSTWDNFEWTLGPTYKFGLYECDPVTMERKPKPSAAMYSALAYKKEITVSDYVALKRK